jgi:hypothetical protein
MKIKTVGELKKEVALFETNSAFLPKYFRIDHKQLRETRHSLATNCLVVAQAAVPHHSRTCLRLQNFSKLPI